MLSLPFFVSEIKLGFESYF